MKNLNFFERVYKAIQKIPDGKVSTYGAVATYLGNPKASRVVGYALHVNPDPQNVKCFKIVNRNGHLADSFAFGGKDAQAKLLISSGVQVDEDYKVDLVKYGYFFEDCY